MSSLAPPVVPKKAGPDEAASFTDTDYCTQQGISIFKEEEQERRKQTSQAPLEEKSMLSTKGLL